MDVRQGYKLTAVGAVPEDWDAKTLGDLSTFITSGSRGWAKYYSDSGALFIRSQNVKEGRLDFSDRQYVTPPSSTEGDRTRLAWGDLLITITGNSVGNVAWLQDDLGEAYVSQHVGLARLLDPDFAQFTCYFLAPGSPGNPQIWGSQAGQSKPGLNLKDLEDFCIACPSDTEQRAISRALNYVDELLGSLDRLITKNRNLKQAAMQKLLTGQIRLPGFIGEWRTAELGAIGKISSAGVDKKIKVGEAPVRLVNYMDVYRHNFLYSDYLNHVVTARPDQAARCAVKFGDVFFTPSSETPSDIAISAVAMEDIQDAAYSYHVMRFRVHEDWDVRFRAYIFKSQKFLDEAARASEGSGVRYVITQAKFKRLTVRFPVEKVEQTAIAAILSDMDAKLAALEQRLTKTRALKQAMMQELLTGRTRLI